MSERKHRSELANAPFWKQRGWVLSAGFLAVVMFMAAISLVTGQDSASGATVTGEGKQPVMHGQQNGGRPEGCRTNDKDKTRPTAAPLDVRWRLIGGVRVPASPSAGPRRADGPVRWCFAHTPTGAVMAAHTIPSQMSGRHWRTVAEQQVVPGAGRNVFAAQRSAISASDASSRAVGQYSGFSLASYTRSAATVRLLIRNSQGSYGSTSISLRWQGGDWKVEPRSDGSLHTPVTTATNATGFIVWGARHG